jgi:hypothetical protein
MILCLLFLVLSKFYFAPHGSVLYSVLQPLAAKLILNDTFVAVVRWLYRMYRQFLRKKATVRLFIAADDPHSYMLLQALPLVTDRFCNVEICVCVVALGMSSWSIGKEKQLTWAIKDCSLFAALYGLLPPVTSALPSATGEPMPLLHAQFGEDGLPVDVAVRERLERVNLRTAQQVLGTQQSGNKDGRTSSTRAALACMHSLWGRASAMCASDEPSSPRTRRYNLRSRFSNVADADLPTGLSPAPSMESPVSNDGDTQQLHAVMESNTALLRRLGYYGPGIVEFEGEWYQLGRLHHLEHRLGSDDTIQQRCDAAKGRQGGHGGNSAHTAPISQRPHFCRELEGHGALYDHYRGGHAQAARIDPTSQAEAQHGSEGAQQVPGRGGKPGQRATSGCGHLDESGGSIPDIEVFYSFRSPYSQLVLDRLQRLCDVYPVRRNETNAGDRGLPRKINVAVRPLMPMVSLPMMTGLLGLRTVYLLQKRIFYHPNSPVVCFPCVIFTLVCYQALSIGTSDLNPCNLVLPPSQVMRGHSVPLSKAMFIIADCGREARYWGLPFGHICDPGMYI